MGIKNRPVTDSAEDNRASKHNEYNFDELFLHNSFDRHNDNTIGAGLQAPKLYYTYFGAQRVLTYYAE